MLRCFLFSGSAIRNRISTLLNTVNSRYSDIDLSDNLYIAIFYCRSYFFLIQITINLAIELSLTIFINIVIINIFKYVFIYLLRVYK